MVNNPWAWSPGPEEAMCTTATAKRRRKQAKLRKGRKTSKLDRKAMLLAKQRRK
jgi:hypothetical protein